MSAALASTGVGADEPAPTNGFGVRRRIIDAVVGFVSHLSLSAWSIIVIVPLAWTALASFKTSAEIFGSPFSLPKNWSIENYRVALRPPSEGGAGFGNFFLNTVVVVGSALVIVMLLGAMCAYVLARFRFFGNRFIYYLMLAGLTFPVFLAIVPLFKLLQGFKAFGDLIPLLAGQGLLNTQPGLIIVYVAFALPFTVFFLFPFFKKLPDDVAEAAAVDGASEWRTFFRVMLPMAKPGMAAVAIFNFLGLWNQFLLPVALNTNQDNWVLSQGMASFASGAAYNVDYGALFAAVMITIIPVLIAYIVFQRQLAGSVQQGTSR